MTSVPPPFSLLFADQQQSLASNVQICKHPKPRVRLIEPVSNDVHENTATASCKVCCPEDNNVAKYTCPRCDIPYCSVACFQKHGSDCTEDFSRERVLQNQPRPDAMQMLQRVSDSQRYNNDNVDCSIINRQELLQILEQLEKPSEKFLIQLQKKYPNLDAMLRHALDQGELQEWVIEDWHPWWLADIGTIIDSNDNGDALDTDEQQLNDLLAETGENEADASKQLLDERLLSIPKFDMLAKRGSNNLSYNLVDILWSAVYTLRQFHGIGNAIQSCIPATETFLSMSSVTSRDARYTSLNDVIASLAGPDDNLRNICLDDVSIICSNKRFIARLLLEMTDLLQTSCKLLKKSESVDEETKDNETRKAVAVIKRARKKVEYYMSWAFKSRVQTDNELAILGDSIRCCIDDWGTRPSH